MPSGYRCNWEYATDPQLKFSQHSARDINICTTANSPTTRQHLKDQSITIRTRSFVLQRVSPDQLPLPHTTTLELHSFQDSSKGRRRSRKPNDAEHAIKMARIAQFFSYLHSIMLHVPEQQYHNISRLIQPQIRSIANTFTLVSPRTKSALQSQSTRFTKDASKSTSPSAGRKR